MNIFDMSKKKLPKDGIAEARKGVSQIDTLYNKWHSSKSNTDLASLVSHMEPDINRAIVAAGAKPSPLTRGRAKQVVADAIVSYDPKKGANLRTWTSQQLQRLTRDLRNQRFVVRVPESVAREATNVQSVMQELQADGEVPTIQAVSERLGISHRRAEQLMSSPTPEVLSTEAVAQDSKDEDDDSLIRELVYGDASPQDQFLMEHVLGFKKGIKTMSGKEAAAELGISPSAVSQRLSNIRQRLQEAKEVL